jgi:hypothetical protein
MTYHITSFESPIWKNRYAIALFNEIDVTCFLFYKTMAVPVLLYGSDVWVPNRKIRSIIQNAEMV